MNLKLQRLLGRLYRDEEKPDGGDGGGGGASGGSTATAGGTGDGEGAGGAGGGAAGGAGSADTGKSGGAPAAGEGGAKGGSDGEGAPAGGKGNAGEDGPWGADWRTKLAGGDEKLLKLAGRYADPGAIAKSLAQLQAKISAGELRQVKPAATATEEDRKAWREANGIPADAKGYDLGDLKIPDADKPLIESFLQASHAADATPAQVKNQLDWYYKTVEAQTTARAEQDRQQADQAQEQLRVDWGTANYKANMNAVNNLLASAPEAVRDRLMHGRLADGRPIMADPDSIKWLHGLALEINPVAALDIPTGQGNMTGIESRIKEIETTMRTNRAAYNKDEKMQAEYRQLLEAREKLGAK